MDVHEPVQPVPGPPREPERLRIHVSRGTWATWVLIGLNVAVFVWTLIRGGPLMDVSEDAAFGVNYGPAVFRGGEWWRLVTSMFLHGGLMHLALNMWGLRVLGPFVESVLGGTAFLILYFVAGAGASLVSIAMNFERPSLGASGAIFALLGAHVAFFLRHRREMPGALFRGQMRSVGFLIALNIAFGLSIPQVDNAAHVGGLLMGFAGGLLLDRPLLQAPRMTTRRWIGAAAFAALLVLLTFLPAAVAILRGQG
jgi:rhomboid protease GluP